MAEVERSVRYRVNISTSTRGIKTWDCTVELTQDDEDMAHVLFLSDRLVSELEARYRIALEVGKEE